MISMVEYQTIGGWDYAVLFLTLLISLSIGIYFRLSGGKQKTPQEFLLGNRNQQALPVAVSITASFMSAVTLLGVTAEVYMFGTLFLTIIGSYIFFTGVAAYLYLPVFFKLQATSAYEYLELRFGPNVRLAASLLYSLQMVLYMGVVLYAPAIAMEALTGISRNIAILLVGGICTIYSTIGGIKAVIWTDVFQSGLMYMSLFSVVGMGIWKHGGLEPIWKIADQHGRLEFFNFSPDPTMRHTTWSLAIGGGFTFLSLYAVNQTQVQRYLTMRDHRTAVKSLWISLPFLYLLLIACGLAGLSIFSMYYNCDPVRYGRISSLDQLMPLFVMDTMGTVPGLSGLFAAGIFSASLSTVSACVNSLAAVTVEDYLKQFCYQTVKSEFTQTAAISKCLVLVYGIACVGVAFLAQYLGGLLQAGLSILGIVGGPLLGTFTLGMFLPFANEPGALSGMMAGLITSLWLGFGGPKPKPVPLTLSIAGCPNVTHTTPLEILTTTLPTPSLASQVHYPYMYRLSYLLYVVISFFITIFVGCMISHLASQWGYRAQPINPDYFTPPVARYLRRRRHIDDMALQQAMLNGHDVQIKKASGN